MHRAVVPGCLAFYHDTHGRLVHALNYTFSNLPINLPKRAQVMLSRSLISLYNMAMALLAAWSQNVVREKKIMKSIIVRVCLTLLTLPTDPTLAITIFGSEEYLKTLPVAYSRLLRPGSPSSRTSLLQRHHGDVDRSTYAPVP